MVPLKVLLADDDADDRMLFEEAIAELPLKADLLTVSDGDELLDYLSDPTILMPDLVFLDLNMPRKNGIDCLREIRSDKRLDELFIAIYSTSVSGSDIEDTFNLGANIYIRKPDDYSELKEVLSNVLIQNGTDKGPDRKLANFAINI